MRQAELFTAEPNEYISMKAKVAKQQVILIANDAVQVEATRKFYMPQQNEKHLKQYVMIKWEIVSRESH